MDLMSTPNENIGPHVVVLGAGASRAAFPSGDRFSRKVPVMSDLIETVGLRSMINDISEKFKKNGKF